MSDKLISIGEFPDINQAAHAQMHLESVGIDSFIENKDMAAMMPILNPGVKLMVREDEMSEAIEILRGKEPETEEISETLPTQYAGFWLRVFAIICDGLLAGFAWWPINISWQIFGAQYAIPKEAEFIKSVIITISAWLYFALMESSRYQATLGKKVFGIRVTDLSGNRISFLRASARFWLKNLSWLTAGVGFVMAGLTLRKQALHDIMANCLVIRKYKPVKREDKA